MVHAEAIPMAQNVLAILFWCYGASIAQRKMQGNACRCYCYHGHLEEWKEMSQGKILSDLIRERGCRWRDQNQGTSNLCRMAWPCLLVCTHLEIFIRMLLPIHLMCYHLSMCHRYGNNIYESNLVL